MIKSASPTTLTFNRSDASIKQAFSFGVTFQYLKVEEMDLLIAEDNVPGKSLAEILGYTDQLFYPLLSKS